MKDLIIGVDYENVYTILEKAGLKTLQGLYYRISKLKKRGVVISRFYDDKRKTCYLREDADKIIDYEEIPRKYPKNRKEPPKGTRPGKQKVEKEEN